MYSKEFWNNVYKFHMKDAPWMSDSCVQNQIDFIEQNLHEIKGKRLLDYGCGDAQVSYYFYQKGAIIDLADISDNLISWLKTKYKEHNDIRIFQVATPQDLPDDNGLYDIIIANCIFHHIQPELWNSFLKGFSNILNKGGFLVISGWDESDDFLKKEQIATFTNNKAWPITALKENIDKMKRFDVIVDIIRLMDLPQYFNKSRRFRYYLLRRK